MDQGILLDPPLTPYKLTKDVQNLQTWNLFIFPFWGPVSASLTQLDHDPRHWLTHITHTSQQTPKPKVHTVYATYHPSLAITSHYAGYSASDFNFTWKHLNFDSGFMCVLIASVGGGGEGGQRHFSCRQSNKERQSPIILRQPMSLFLFFLKKRLVYKTLLRKRRYGTGKESDGRCALKDVV
jgi:hypothetical protein